MITAILAFLFMVIPVWLFVIAVRKFITDTRRRAHNREQANRRFRNRTGR